MEVIYTIIATILSGGSASFKSVIEADLVASECREFSCPMSLSPPYPPSTQSFFTRFVSQSPRVNTCRALTPLSLNPCISCAHSPTLWRPSLIWATLQESFASWDFPHFFLHRPLNRKTSPPFLLTCLISSLRQCASTWL